MQSNRPEVDQPDDPIGYSCQHSSIPAIFQYVSVRIQYYKYLQIVNVPSLYRLFLLLQILSLLISCLFVLGLLFQLELPRTRLGLVAPKPQAVAMTVLDFHDMLVPGMGLRGLGPSGWLTRVFSRGSYSYCWIARLRPFSYTAKCKKRESSSMVTLNGNDIMLGNFVLRSFIHAFIQFRPVPFHCIHAFIHALMPFNSAPFHSVIIQLFIIHSIIYWIYSFLPSFLPSFLYSLIHSLIRSFVRSFIHSFIHSFLPSFLPSFIRSFVHSFIHSLIDWAKTFNTHYMTLWIFICTDGFTSYCNWYVFYASNEEPLKRWLFGLDGGWYRSAI